ncbi:MAG: hypothetical protein JKY65_07185 [Planctomycetes bacterium]|nr:hypothetical protein [Planctomycetota bacterium]
MSTAQRTVLRHEIDAGGGVRPSLWRRTLGPYLSTVPEVLLVFQFACQVAMLLDFLGPLRRLLRIATFASSGLLLVWLLVFHRSGRGHPATLVAYGVMGLLCLGLLHPETNTLLAALAQIAMYLTILAPLFWVPRIRVDLHSLRRVLLLLLAFHAVSSLFGVLQASFPGQFMPSPAFAAGENYEIKLASGARVLRLMGLTDTPGGAATSGFYAVLLGVAFLVSEKTRKLRVASSVAITLGMFCLYLAQSRSRFVLTAICVAVFLAVLAYRGQVRRFATAVVIGSVLVLGAFSWAVSVGGESASKRLGTLATTDPAGLYARNRGYYLNKTILELAPENPLGAGLGRWGMMNVYFGDSAASAPIFVEIQITGWVVDGGYPMLFLYGGALLLALWVSWRLAVRGSLKDSLWLYATLVFAYDLGAVAWCFSYSVFMSQMGLELWLLNALLFGAYVSRQPVRSRREVEPWEQRALGRVERRP